MIYWEKLNYWQKEHIRNSFKEPVNLKFKQTVDKNGDMQGSWFPILTEEQKIKYIKENKEWLTGPDQKV